MKIKCPICGTEIDITREQIMQESGRLLGEKNKGRQSPVSRENIKKARAALSPEQRLEALARAREVRKQRQQLAKEFRESPEYQEFLKKRGEN